MGSKLTTLPRREGVGEPGAEQERFHGLSLQTENVVPISAYAAAPQVSKARDWACSLP